ncbi:MAG: selenocysteine-specific translation elongation factor [Nitrospirae bacterium]|jgi:selenocysteine-specific elongation factor|nr:selenocysteine-specific translation elongation factor [Nitrospirota bacterium]
MRHIILGTAGHIDHGKSSLVKALTGIDPDRLKEEKERGITIDLGFADIVYPDGLTVGIVDVPGHERLIKNMLAGAGGIDLVMLVIAADEGIMPQSKEHLQICNLLKIKSGLIAVTKADLVEQDWLELVKEDVKEFVRGTFLEGAEIIPVSSKSMFNIELLKERIKDIALKVEPKPIKGLFRLPIDRVFTLKGFGTVVTGTAILGSISVDNDIEILPSNIKSKVRGLHSHGKAIHSAYAGQRVAINLQGVDKDSIQRGDVVVIPGKLMPTGKIDAKIELLSDAPVLKTRSLVHFHLGTSETTARVILFGQSELKPGENCYGQFRLSSPVVAMSGDRYIIRRFSPLETIGGGEVLDPLSFRRSFRESVEDLKIFEIGSLSDKIAAKIKRAGAFGIKTSIIEGWIKEEIPSIKESIKYLKEKNTVLQFEDILIHRTIFDSFKNNVIQQLSEFHKANPLKPGMSKEELRIKLNIEPRLFGNLISTLNEIVIEKEFVRLNSFKVALSDKDESTQLKIIQLLEKSEFQPPSKDEISQTLKIDPKKLQDILKLMSNEGKLIRISDTIYITSDVYEKIIKKMKDFFSKKPEMTVAEFRDILNTTRKYALPFLEYLDSHNVTLRVGDIRKLLSR